MPGFNKTESNLTGGEEKNTKENKNKFIDVC